MPTVCPKHGNVERNKWGQCPDCLRANRKKYELTEKGELNRRKYDLSKRGRSLNNQRAKRFYSTYRGKLAIRRYAQKWRQTPEGKLKRSARDAVRWATHTGKLTKLPCQVCGNPKSEAHHYLGYSKEHRLHVVFLCRAHHIIADEELKSKAPVV